MPVERGAVAAVRHSVGRSLPSLWNSGRFCHKHFTEQVLSVIAMALLPILRYPDPRLKKIAQPVTQFDAQLRQLVADMAETMYEAPGIGLAATQVDVHQQVVVIDISEDKSDLRVLINPRIEAASGSHLGEEGCLSVPGIYDKVERSEVVTVHFQDLDGQARSLRVDGLLAVCVQHELDHLNGMVFVDHLSQLKQGRIKNKLAKQARVTA